MGDIPVYSLIGWSGVGKTTFLERLIVFLRERGIRVAVIKEVPKAYSVDAEGKDTWRFARAGAEQVCIANPESAVMMIYRPVPVAEMIASIHDVDLILTEGHHKLGYPQLEIYREAVAHGLRCPDREHLVAVITQDSPELGAGVRRFSFDDLQAISDFMLKDYPARGGHDGNGQRQ